MAGPALNVTRRAAAPGTYTASVGCNATQRSISITFAASTHAYESSPTAVTVAGHDAISKSSPSARTALARSCGSWTSRTRGSPSPSRRERARQRLSWRRPTQSSIRSIASDGSPCRLQANVHAPGRLGFRLKLAEGCGGPHSALAIVSMGNGWNDRFRGTTAR